MSTKTKSRASRHTGTRHPLRPWLISGLLALALVIFMGQQVFAQVQRANDEAAIKKVVLRAFGASLEAVVVPNTLADYSQKVGKQAKALVAAQSDLAVAKTNAETMFDGIYDTKCVPCKDTAGKTLKTLQSEGNGTFRALAWGVHDIGWVQMIINDTTASVTLSGTLWSKVQYLNEKGKLKTLTPTGGEVIIYSLAKTDAGWLITNQVPDDVSTSNLPINKQTPNGQSGTPPADEPTPVKANPTVPPK